MGGTLLIAQAQWNRLDVFDAETGANLTEREVFKRDSGRRDEQGGRVHDQRNYIDYFHSVLHVSPDSRHFLSNGWVWSPVDLVRVFSTEAFLTGYEPTSIPVGTAFGYNWDRPCAFVDDRTFVLALDGSVDTLDADEAAACRYRQLAFFKSRALSSIGDTDRWLEPSSLADCDVFPRNQYGEIKGELHYDLESGCLVAMTDGDGSFVVSLAGDVVARMPDLSLASLPSHGDFGSRHSSPAGGRVRRSAGCSTAGPTVRASRNALCPQHANRHRRETPCSATLTPDPVRYPRSGYKAAPGSGWWSSSIDNARTLVWRHRPYAQKWLSSSPFSSRPVSRVCDIAMKLSTSAQTKGL